jgi:predicted transglutaminase-like cysteine proteinase
LAIVLSTALCLAPAAAPDFDRLMQTFVRNGGERSAFNDWRMVLERARQLPRPVDKLRLVNGFFNHRLRFAEDKDIWGQSDYWATPMETLAKNTGDCEDFTIAKYFTLLDAGIPDRQLRLVYVKAAIGGPASTVFQAHMVLAYYSTPDAEPLVLDNLITDIRPASRRPDLAPVFSFNSQGIWQGASGSANQSATGIDRLSRWQNLLRRTRQEGFD